MYLVSVTIRPAIAPPAPPIIMPSQIVAIVKLPNDAVEKVVEGSRKMVLRGDKTIPRTRIVQYSTIVEVVFRTW
jgi:hypothetical protein